MERTEEGSEVVLRGAKEGDGSGTDKQGELVQQSDDLSSAVCGKSARTVGTGSVVSEEASLPNNVYDAMLESWPKF